MQPRVQLHHHHHQRAQSEADHYSQVQEIDESPPRYTAPRPPPALPRSRGPTCCAWSLACIGCLLCVLFLALLVVEIPFVTNQGGKFLTERRRAHRAPPRHSDPGAVGSVALGLWDEQLTITPLQLTVSLSMAIGVDEADIHVTALTNYFFDVRFKGGQSLVAQLEAPEFLEALNGQAELFGATLVISHSAVLDANNSTEDRRFSV
tara:strand:+ start:1818 stop:2435 length:618 start_codon:yes stop_codon:yes gene_type:complete